MNNSNKPKKRILPSVILSVLLYYIIRVIKNSPSLPSFKSLANSASSIFISSDFYVNLFYTIKIVTIGRKDNGLEVYQTDGKKCMK